MVAAIRRWLVKPRSVPSGSRRAPRSIFKTSIRFMLASSIWTPTGSGLPLRYLSFWRMASLDFCIGIDPAERALIFGQRGFMRVWCEASLSCRCHGTCLSIDFHDVDSGEESHGGCGRRLVMAERSFGSIEEWWRMFFPVCRVLKSCSGDLGRRGRQYGWKIFLGVLLEYRAAISGVQV